MTPETGQLLAELLQIGAGVAVASAGGNQDVILGANLASSLITIVQKGIAAYEAQTGQPIDPSLLRPFVPLTDADAPQA